MILFMSGLFFPVWSSVLAALKGDVSGVDATNWVNLSTSSQAAWGPFYKGKARERGCGSTLRVLSWLGEENILITVHLITQGNKVFPPFFGGGIFEWKWMREFHTGKSTKVYEMQLESFHLPSNVSQFLTDSHLHFTNAWSLSKNVQIQAKP